MVQHVTKIEVRNQLENNSSWETNSDPKGGPSGTARPKITAPTKNGWLKYPAKNPNPKNVTMMAWIYILFTGFPSGVFFTIHFIAGRPTSGMQIR